LLENISSGLQFLVQPGFVMLTSLGTLLGLIFGAIPGLTSTLAIVLIMPVTFGMDPTLGLAMLTGIYIGGVSGGQISAILLNMPGTPASIATCFDGYPMAKKGLAGKALSYGIVASFIGGMLSLLALVIITPLLGRISLKFQTYEYFLLGVFGLTIISSLTSKSLLQGIASAALGLMLAAVGADPLSGVARYTFGIAALDGGIGMLPAMIGLFVISEIFAQISEADSEYVFESGAMDSMKISLKEILSHWKNLLRSSLIGIVIGILPGAGGTIANLFAYDQAKKYSKYPEEFGTGIPDGIIAPESANNAVTGGAFVPMLTLGIPGNSVTAILMAGLMLHGLTPGPGLFRDNIGVVYSIFASLFVANIVMVILFYAFLIRFFKWALRVPKKILLPVVVLMAVAGTYNIRYSFNDLWVLAIFSGMGFVFRRTGFPISPMILGLILGPIMEGALRTGMMRSGGSIMPFFTRPWSLGLIALTIISVCFSGVYKRFEERKKRALLS
jgi:putative tricarboxylic transport membrane protein